MLDQFLIPVIEWTAILPLIIVAVTGMLALLLDMYRPNRSNDNIAGLSVLGLLIALVFTLGVAGKSMMSFGSMFYIDSLGHIGQSCILISAIITILFSENYLRTKKIPFGEFYPLILWASLGAMILCATRNLLMIFVGIEILSISLYVLAGMNRGNVKSEESALKYFLLGAFATGFLLYGIAFFYGATGTLEISSFSGYWGQGRSETRLLLSISVGLILVGLGFKSSLVPFHQWTPDVYSGAPTNVVAFMATGGKVGIFVVLYEFASILAQVQEQLRIVFVVLAVLTMTIGNILAFVQKDLKRMLAYSSVANAGYVMVAIASAVSKISPSSTSISYFILGYVFTTLGTFAVISTISKADNESLTYESLNGLSKRAPFATAALVIFALSSIGIGPVAGFLGKFLIIGDAVQVGLVWLATALVLNSIFGAYYYFAMIKAAFTAGDEENKPVAYGPAVASALGICIIGVVGSVIFFTPIMEHFAPR